MEDIIEVPFGAFQILPTDMKILILQTLNIKDLVELCTSSKTFNNFYKIHNNRIWKGVVERDFGVNYEGTQIEIYKDLLIAKKFLKKYNKGVIDRLMTFRRKNYFGIIWLLNLQGKFAIDPSADENKIIAKASTIGNPKVVKFLLSDKRVDPSANDNYPIRIASRMGNLEVTKLLLDLPEEYGIDPSANYNDAIQLASEHGYFEVVKLLLNDPRVDPSENFNWSISWAVRNGHVEVVKLLLKDERVMRKLTDEKIEEYSNMK